MAIALTTQLTGLTPENLPVETRYPNNFLPMTIDNVVATQSGTGGRLWVDWLPKTKRAAKRGRKNNCRRILAPSLHYYK